MVTEEYIAKLKDPSSWYDFYRQQRLIAGLLFKELQQKEQILKLRDGNDADYIAIFANVHYHWGIAIENGFKAIIAKNFPEKIEFEIKGDNVKLKSIGGNAGRTHNLLELAKSVGVFDNKEIQQQYAKPLLLHLSDMIKWGARYPITNNTATIFKFNNKIPPQLIYGFHILDVIMPLFDVIDKTIKGK